MGCNCETEKIEDYEGDSELVRIGRLLSGDVRIESGSGGEVLEITAEPATERKVYVSYDEESFDYDVWGPNVSEDIVQGIEQRIYDLRDSYAG